MESVEVLTVSDMIKFSSNSNDNEGSILDNVGCELDLPNLSILNIKEETSAPITETNLPAFSEILSENKPQRSEQMQSNENLPHLSALLENGLHTNTQPQDDYLPVLSALNADAKSTKGDSSHNSLFTDMTIEKLERRDSDGSDNRRPSLNVQFSHFSNISRNASRTACVSPLPNLSLNTILKHFSYCELEAATNNFDETPHINSLEKEDSVEQSNGRFLGSGAFGSVFLAVGLLETPVAVKRLYLSNPDVVNVDDAVTKQFRNEVEVLWKYKHDNLVSLVGYSCDGPTYCLMYEYISGGALKDRLQVKFVLLNIY